MKTYWGVEVQLYEFLTSALDGDEWSASRFGRFTPRTRASGIHWRLGGTHSQSGRSGEEKKITSLSLPGTEPRSSSW